MRRLNCRLLNNLNPWLIRIGYGLSIRACY